MITVIIPVYNCEKYLNACVDSVLLQTYQPKKIILVYDKSIDGSLAICLDYEKQYEQISVINSNKSGPGGTRNTGLYKVKTKYVYFLDCDDVIIPRALEILYNECKKHQLDMITGLSVNANEEGVLSKRYGTYPKETTIMNSEQYLHFVITHSLIGVNIWGNMYATDFLVKNNISFTEHIILDDLATSLLIGLSIKRAKFIPFVFYHYYQRPKSIMRVNKDWAKIFYDIYLYYEKTLKTHHVTSLQKESAYQFICYVVSECIGKAFVSKQGMYYIKKLKQYSLVKESIHASRKKKHMLLRLLYTFPRLLGFILLIYKKNSTK